VDRVPKCSKFPCSMVINLDKSTEEGSHWVCVYARNRSNVYFFDSLGQPPNEEILQKFQCNFKHVIYSNKTIQSLFSNVCGHFCIVFIYYMSLGIEFNKLIRYLYSLKNPDLYVKMFVKQFVIQ
jgi:hypothetical protein